MGFIDDNQTVVFPIQPIEINAIGNAAVAGKVSMIQHIIPQSVPGNRIIDIIALESVPVVCQFFRAKDQYTLVAFFIIFYDRQRRKSLAQTNAVSKNTSIVLFQFIDDRKDGIFLEIIEFVPNKAVFETNRLIGQYIFGNIFQKLIENVVKRDKINELRGVFPVSHRNIIYDLLGNILHFSGIIPK